jgi:hypothetical protein
MARFNARGHQAKPAVATVSSPLGTTVSKKADTRTFQGAKGWTRDAKSELFLRATGAFHGGESTFYESADKRDDRLRELVRTIAIEDPDWGFEFARWLRTEGNMRTAALMFAVEYVHERLAAQQRGVVGTRVGDPREKWATVSNRRIIDVVCQRPDEPGEILAIWTAWYGRRIPQPVKRGVADAVRRLYNQRSLLKYDTETKAYRFGDVLELTHPTPDPDKPWQGELFKFAIDRRHGRISSTQDIPLRLDVIMRNAALRENGDAQLWLNPEFLRSAGMTWEDALSAVGSKVDKAKLWEALIPSMGIMASIRNLRNFDQAGVSDRVAMDVMERLTDPEQIARSKQFPFRFLAAYRATEGSLRWAWPLEQALNHSLVNVPALSGRTLILVDRSPSMFPEYDHWFPQMKKSDISRADQAAVFGSALALRAEKPTLVEFGGQSRVIQFERGTSVLKLVDKFKQDPGTDIPSAVKRHYDGHDRVVILTDEQSRPGYLPSNMWRGYGGMPETEINDLVPANVPVFIWNFAGYSAAAMPSGNEARFHLGGLTDKAFRLIPILESGTDGGWPWELDNSSGVQ